MKWLALLAFLLSPTLLMAQTTQPVGFAKKLADGKPQKIVCFGTSLTEHGAWVKQLQEALDKAYPKLATVVNSGGSGQTSKWGVANVQKKVVEEKPDVVFIEFTTNDAVERFKMPVEESKKNLTTIIDAILKSNPDTQIVLQIMNPVVGYPPGHTSHRKDLPAYWEMYRQLGKAREFTVIDHSIAWQKLLDQGEAEYKKFVPDGLHPGGPGYAKYVMPTIVKQLGIKKD